LFTLVSDIRQFIHCVRSRNDFGRQYFPEPANALREAGETADSLEITSGMEIRFPQAPVRIERKDSIILSISYSPDGKRLATSSSNKIEILNLESRTLSRTISMPFENALVVYSPDGAQVVACNTQTLSTWNPRTGNLIRILYKYGGEFSYVKALTHSPDTSHVAIGLSKFHPIFRSCIELRDTTTGELMHTLAARDGHVLTYSPDGKYLASPLLLQMLGLWDPATGRQLWTCRGGVDIAFSPDSKHIVTLHPSTSDTAGGEIKIRDALTRDMVTSTRCEPGSRPQLVAYSPDGKQLAVGNEDGVIELRDPTTLDLQRKLQHPSIFRRGKIQKLIYSPGGKELALITKVPIGIQIWEYSQIRVI
jgi:WD40 repeat protein